MIGRVSQIADDDWREIAGEMRAPALLLLLLLGVFGVFGVFVGPRSRLTKA